MFEADKYIRKSYEAYLYNWVSSALWIGSAIVILLIPLDFLASSSHFRTFLVYRIIASIALLVLFALNRKKINHRYQSVMAIAGCAIVSTMVALMIYELQGHRSPYFSGFIIVAIVGIGYIPLQFRTSLIVSSLIYLMYLIPILIYDTITDLSFFIAANILTVFCISSLLVLRYLAQKQLMREFALRCTVEQSERQLADSQKIGRIGSWDWDIVNNTLHWSDETFRRFDKDALTFRPTVEYFLDRIHPDDRESVRKAIRGLQEDNGLSHVLARVCNESGRQWMLEGFGAVERDSSGQPVRFVGTAQDVTERSLMEERLRQSEKKYRELVEAANSVILTWDTSGNITYLNNFAEQFFGYSKKELLGRNVVGTIVPPAESSGRDLALLMEEIRRAPDRFRDNENENITKDGSRVWIRWTNKAIMDEQGTLVGILSIGIDITERKHAEEALRLTRFTVDNVADAVYWMDSTARIVDVNETACSMLGYAREEFLKLTVLDIDPDFTAEKWANAWETLKCQGRITLETRHRTRDGRIIPVEIMANYLSFGGTELDCAFARDITERKRLEQEILRSQKLEAIGTLAGGIAHDFNNLLQGVFGYISMAKLTHDQKEKSIAMLEHAEKALHMSVNLTTQLLTFSKGGRPIKKKIELQAVIQNAALFALSGSDLDYRIELEEGLWTVDADEGQIGQVIQNIVINADQAMPAGGTVVITARNVVGPDKNHPAVPSGKFVEISIQDTGIGIPGQNMQKIFDPYFTTKDNGSGLGLATSYSIIRNHGGLINAMSELGKGTTFFIYLPALEYDKDVAETVAVPPTGRIGRILVMDDEKLVRDIARELILALGHEIDLAENGETAIEKCQSARESGKPFDIVILDLTVRGGMGGRETIERLRAIDPGIKAIVSSGYSDDPVVADYEKYGFKAQLPKPYKLDDLRNTLNALMRQ